MVPSPPRLPVEAVVPAGDAAACGVPWAAVDALCGVPMAAVEPALADDELEDELLLDELLLELDDDEVLALLPQAASRAEIAGAASPKAAARFNTSRLLRRCSRAARVSCSMRDNLDTGSPPPPCSGIWRGHGCRRALGDRPGTGREVAPYRL